jgi:hypothetical protein
MYLVIPNDVLVMSAVTSIKTIGNIMVMFSLPVMFMHYSNLLVHELNSMLFLRYKFALFD